VRQRTTALVTGGAGFIGSNLVDRLAAGGCKVIVFDTLQRPGVERNLAWLKQRHGRSIAHRREDVRDADAVLAAARNADVIFHLAAQVAVTTSVADPRADFSVNLGGTFNVLEAARQRCAPVVFASTNKVYGDLADLDLALIKDAYAPTNERIRKRGVDEKRPLVFHTPYGCSKGGADQYVLDYARTYGVPACVLRMSCIYGPRQMGTEDQGWVAHFLIRTLSGQPITVYGDGRQVRDILEVSDAVNAYLSAWRKIDAVRGRALNLGGGVANAISLRQLLSHIEAVTGRRPDVRYEGWRVGDQRYFVADISAARRLLELAPPTPWREGVERLASWIKADGALIEVPAETVAA